MPELPSAALFLRTGKPSAALIAIVTGQAPGQVREQNNFASFTNWF